jgi:hypothetical protein
LDCAEAEMPAANQALVKIVSAQRRCQASNGLVFI